MKRILTAVVAYLVSAATVVAQVPYFPQTLPGHTIVGRSSATAGPTEAITFSQLAGLILPNPYTGSVATSLTVTLPDAGVGRTLNDAVSFLYTGGTAGTVVTNQYATTTASAANTNYVWGVLSIMNNNAAAGQNVAGYWQGLKNAVGPTWAGVMEVRDTTHTANPTQALQGLEVDIVANGTDTGLKRAGLVIAAARDSAAAADATISNGLSFAVFAADIGNLTVSNGIMFTSGLYTKGINFNGGATYTSAAIHLPSDNGILMDTGGNASLAYSASLASTLLTENTSAGNSVDNVLTIGHTANGTFAAGMGVGISYRVMTAAATNKLAGYSQVVSSDVGSGTETFDYVVQLMASGVAAAEKGRILSSGGFRAPAAGIYEFSGRSRMNSASDGVLALTNAAATDFSRLNLGGATASFPAIKRSSAAVAFRLADDSADAAITTAAITATGNITAPATGVFVWNGRATAASPADGIIELLNNAATDFTRLQFGGTTSSFPAIKRSAATLAFRLADDSADAVITTAALTASGLVTGTAFTPSSSTVPANGLYLPSANKLGWATNSAAVMFLDSTGALSAGLTPSGLFVAGTVSPLLQVHGASSIAGLGAARYSADGNPALLEIAKSRHATVGSHTIVQSGDQLGTIRFAGSNGTNFDPAASISAQVDATPGATTDMPGALYFKTSADGTATLSERLRIDSNAFTRVTGSFGRGAPVTKNADWTQATTENYIISDRGATNTVTLPSASTFPGREVVIKTVQAQTVVSNASNVVPCVGGSVSTAILAGTAGKWALLVSDGANWQIMSCN